MDKTRLATATPDIPTPDIQSTDREVWLGVLSSIKTRLPAREFDIWFGPARFLSVEGDVVRIQVPNPTFANHLEVKYRDRILRAFEAAGNPVKAIRCHVSEKSSETSDLPEVPPAGTGIHANESGRWTTQSDPLSADYCFDSFVVGASNRCAYSAALAVSDPGVYNSPYNPLLIYGDVGLGKTHLLQAIARRLLEENPNIRILYTKGEAFTRHVVNAVRTQNLYGFRDECARLDVLLVDDIQFIAGLDRFGRSTEEFFHTFNALTERGRQIILTANAHPQDIQNLDTRVKSRLECGLTTDVGQPDWEMRVAIVIQKAAALGVDLPDGIAQTIASRYKNHVRELEGSIKRLIATSRAEGIEISARLLDRILSTLPSGRARRPSIQEVLMAVAKAFGLPPLRLTGPQRSQEIVLARHAAMYLCREVTGRTLKEIGKELRRDHSTVTHGIRRIAAQRERDLGLDRVLERLLRQLS